VRGFKVSPMAEMTPPLPGPPLKERFEGPLKPIPN
jgi:hypothetical protein